MIAFAVVALMMASQPVLAQGKTKGAKLDKANGFVRGDSIKGKMFVIGAQKGPISVDATKAKITMKGKTFDLTKLTGGSAVTVEGKMTTTGTGRSAKHKMDAVTVEITYLRGKTAGVKSITISGDVTDKGNSTTTAGTKKGKAGAKTGGKTGSTSGTTGH